MEFDPVVPSELRFYCTGLLSVLRRYRFNTLLGWGIALLGVLSIPIGWRFDGMHGLLELGLSGGTALAGLALVQQSVASLSSYLQIPLRTLSRETAPAQESPVVGELRQLLLDIEQGGWQEAYAAIGKLEEVVRALP